MSEQVQVSGEKRPSTSMYRVENIQVNPKFVLNHGHIFYTMGTLAFFLLRKSIAQVDRCARSHCLFVQFVRWCASNLCILRKPTDGVQEVQNCLFVIEANSQQIISVFIHLLADRFQRLTSLLP